MKVALVNPPWSFDGSIYFGCRAPHLPLEFGYARALLEHHDHEVRLFDAQLSSLDFTQVKAEVTAFAPDMVVLTSAPSYLFWRCAPPELAVPIRMARELRELPALLVIVGPHASTTPASTLRKVEADIAVLGECESVLLELASSDRRDFGRLTSIAYRTPKGQGSSSDVIVQGRPRATDMSALPAIQWEYELISRHEHHHHRFDRPPSGLGAEIETSRGCPYQCTFCAKQNFRNQFRKRPLSTVLSELDQLLAHGVKYVYFIDEIFLPDRQLLEALAEREVAFGVQLRIDNWDENTLELLGRAGCVSIEAGVESVTPEGRERLHKRCRTSTDDLVRLLKCAKLHVPFVQANLIGVGDSTGDVSQFREQLLKAGIWSNEPVPLFPYPGSPEYELRWGTPDDNAWERAHSHYIREFEAFSDIQEQRPVSIRKLEQLA